ncbi:MAG TPA: hypothetical protein VJY15_13220 [Candidatus Acidoferrum sp.]|nr:hypothetical protein [Candidatus Acidoferrum sp.]
MRLPRAHLIEMVCVNFDEGDEVVCSKESSGNPPIEATARLHDVRTVSTVSHQTNDFIPVLRADRFDVPERIAAHGTFTRRNIKGAPFYIASPYRTSSS